MKQKPTIYFDMDQVLFDLFGYCYDNFYQGNRSIDEVKDLHKGKWKFDYIFNMEDDHWHNQIVWEEIPVLPWARGLVDMALEFGDDINLGVMSAPIYSADSCGGKFTAIEENFPELLRDGRFVLGKNKHELVEHTDLLIDDSEWKCKNFAKVGKNKSFYLFPAISNCFWEDIYPLTDDKINALIHKVSINIQAKVQGRL